MGLVSLRALAPRRLIDLARTGSRSVLALPDWAGIGNQLFFLLYASHQQRIGRDFKIIRSARSEDWLKSFPLMRDELTIAPEDARFRDQRDDVAWSELSTRLDADERAPFIARYLVSAGVFAGRELGMPSTLTVNIRRGDYYSDPNVRGLFSFDQIAYLRVVMDRVRTTGNHLTTILVVSDDIAWCRARLGFLEREAPELIFVTDGDPITDLATIACARNLVITNSTFSIWGAYVSNFLHGDNFGCIYAPAFTTRPHSGEPSRSLDRRWSIIDDIPGGWDS